MAIDSFLPSAAAAVMVRVHGPDPKGRKMRQHAFYAAESGVTTLSASGVLLQSEPEHTTLVVTCASIVEPFLLSRPPGALEEDSFQLVRGAELEVLVEVNELESKPSWIAARLLKLVDVSEASETIRALLDVQGSTAEGIWEMGWTLAQANENSQLHRLGAELVVENKKKDVGVWTGHSKEIPLGGLMKTNGSVAAASTRIAVLSAVVRTNQFDTCYKLRLSGPCKRGDVIRAVGSPFGALSPLHFYNSISVGIVSNCWPSSSSRIIMADIRCLPGMEGGPVFNRLDEFIGMLLRPLRQRGSGAEVNLILTSHILVAALQKAGINVLCSRDTLGPTTPVANSSLDHDIQEAVSSVVLVTVGEGAWASGIVLNETGLILTNAHLLEPWRFGKLKLEASTSNNVDNIDTMACNNTSMQSGDGRLHYRSRINQHVRVRVDQPSSRSWHSAKVVFISQGPLDVALLQLISVPSSLRPIVWEMKEPIPGSTAIVIGHGLFGPRSELGSSVTAGVVSRVVKDNSDELVMLQTTAAVHRGGSGGAVVNSDGCMIGLVTSNAKHSGGTVIPYLNFSIPCAALRPVLELALSENPDFVVLKELDKKNELLTTVWAMVPPSYLKTPPLPWQVRPEDRLQKGSQFAKFMADKQGELLPRRETETKTRTSRVASKPAFIVRSSL